MLRVDQLEIWVEPSEKTRQKVLEAGQEMNLFFVKIAELYARGWSRLYAIFGVVCGRMSTLWCEDSLENVFSVVET